MRLDQPPSPAADDDSYSGDCGCCGHWRAVNAVGLGVRHAEVESVVKAGWDDVAVVADIVVPLPWGCGG